MTLVLAACASPMKPLAPTATIDIDSLPIAVEYNLGDAASVQARFPEDSHFRNMPVRLNGLIAAPSGEGGLGV